MTSSTTLYSLLSFVFLCSLVSVYNADEVCTDNPPYMCNDTSTFNRSEFGNDFIFGAATSSYQVEGVEARALGIWDTFTHTWPNKTTDRTNGDIACDSFHLYKEDVAIAKNMSLNGYRMSIAWSRVLPKGRLSGGINEDGVKYYNNLIDELVNNGIKPFVTLFHWDLPQTLQDEYEGFLSPRIIKDFTDFANLCFERFGDRVKHWITLNQPYTYSTKGNGDGSNAPGRCSIKCYAGDSATEPYIVAHNLLLSHAEAVDLYRKRYKSTQKGVIGTTLIARWFIPINNSKANIEAAERQFNFMFGWFMEPLIRGDYPAIMRKYVGDRLPKFSPSQSNKLKGSLDFLGLNYYFTEYATDASTPPPIIPDYRTDSRVKTSMSNSKGPIGLPSFTFYYYPKGLGELLDYIKVKYNNPLTYITENGFNDNGTAPVADLLADYNRIEYHCSHLCQLKTAIKNGSKLKGYFAWSLMDNYEFGQGYSTRFGMNYVNFNTPKERLPKESAKWFTKFLKKNKLLDDLTTTSSDNMISTM